MTQGTIPHTIKAVTTAPLLLLNTAMRVVCDIMYVCIGYSYIVAAYTHTYIRANGCYEVGCLAYVTVLGSVVS